jgi:hypothetical protein
MDHGESADDANCVEALHRGTSGNLTAQLSDEVETLVVNPDPLF